MFVTGENPRKKKVTASLIPIIGAKIRQVATAAANQETPLVNTGQPVIPKPLTAPAGILNRRDVRISEQETFGMNEELQRRRLADLKAPAAESNAEETIDVALPRKEVTQEAFQEAWKAYLDKLKQESKVNIIAIVTVEQPQLKDTTITFQLSAGYQKTLLEEESFAALAFLRERLQNYAISFEYVVNEEEIKVMELLTDKDKYSKLAEKYPPLEKLRKALNLDIRI
ncbi:MAG: hypothetical protein RL226_1229 [Bacteroidota bacterium]